jgi:hypothetical protein
MNLTAKVSEDRIIPNRNPDYLGLFRADFRLTLPKDHFQATG